MYDGITGGLLIGSLLLAAYPYVGYPLALMALSALRTRPVAKGPNQPTMTLMITAYNEGPYIGGKIRNSLGLDYPGDKLQILVTSDGSVDGTSEEILAWAGRDPRVEANILPQRLGKMAAILSAMPKARGEIIVFSDATSLYRTGVLTAFARCFADPCVGGVSGTLRLSGGTEESLKKGEGAYWRYETLLRRLESRIGSTIIAPGSIYAVRKELFVAPPPDTIADDFAVTLGVLEKGYRMVLEEEAYADEWVSTTISEEFERKVRIVAGGIQTLLRYGRLMSPGRGLLAFELVSHKLLRWLVPFAMATAFASNLALVGKGPAYSVLFGLQAVFYGLAAAGFLLEMRGGPARLVSLPFHFTAINLAAVLGWYRQLTGKQPVRWRKTEK